MPIRPASSVRLPHAEGDNLRDLDNQNRDILQFAQDDHHGILRLDLKGCSYQWSFLPAGGGEPLDQGRTDRTC